MCSVYSFLSYMVGVAETRYLQYCEPHSELSTNQCNPKSPYMHILLSTRRATGNFGGQGSNLRKREHLNFLYKMWLLTTVL